MKEEDLKYENFWPKLLRYAADSEDIRRAQDMIEELTPAYLAIEAMLTEEEQDQLMLYIGAIDARMQYYAVAAYEMGREEGPRKPSETFRDWVDNPDEWEKILALYDEDGKLRTDL